MSGFDPTLYGATGSAGATGSTKAANPYGVDFSAAPSGKPKKARSKKAAAPKTTPLQDLLNGTVSLGQGIINTVETPLYFLEDVAYNAIKNAKNPTKTNQAIAKQGYLGWLGGEWAKSGQAATAWQRGQEVKHQGGAIAKELGLTTTDKSFLGKTQNVVAGLAFDVALDPLTYVPLAPVFKILKGVSQGGKQAVKGAVEGAKGMVPIETAAARGVTAETATGVKEVVPKGKLKKNVARPVGEVSKGAEYQATYLKKLEGTKTQLVGVPDAANRAASQKAKDAVATSLDMGVKALRASLLTSNANKFLEKYAAQEAKAIKKGLQVSAEAEKVAPKVAEDIAAPKPSEVAMAVPEVPKKVGKVANTPEVVAASVGTKDIKQLKAIEKKITGIATKTTGVRAAAGDVVQSIENIIKRRSSIDTSLFTKTSAEFQKSFADNFRTVPLIGIRDALASPDAAKAQWAAAVAKHPVKLTNGETTIGKLIDSGQKFTKLDKTDQQIVRSTIEAFINGKKANEVTLARINDLTRDPAITKQLIDAGALTPKTANKAKIKEILDASGVSNAAAKVSYTNVEDIIAGLRAGDTIPTASMKNILRALDPDHKVLADIEKKSAPEANAMLADVLKGSVPETLATMRKRIALADPETFLKATGLGSADAVAAYLDARMLGNTSVLTPSIFEYQRAAAAKAVSEMTASELNTATTVIRETFGTRWEKELQLLAEEGGSTRISTYLDKAVLAGKKAWTGKGAILPDQANQSFQAIAASKMAGIGTYRTGQKVRYLKPEDYAKFVVSDDKMRRFVNNMSNMHDTLLATYGIRMQVQKVVEKGAKLESKHNVFIHMGDIVRTFMNTEGNDVMRRAFFISEEGYEKRDSLDVVSILNVVRQVMENNSKGLPHNLEELNKIARHKADITVLTKKYQAELEKNASDFVDHLIAKAAPELEKVHLNRSMAATEDFLKTSMDITPALSAIAKDAWAISIGEGWGTPEHRYEMLKDLLNRFSYVARLMEQDSGETAYAVMNATAMLFVKNGKIAEDVGSTLDEVFKLMPDVGSAEYGKIMETFDTYGAKELPVLVDAVEHVDHAVDVAKAAKEDAATAVISKVAEVEALPLAEEEQAVRLLQEFYNEQMAAKRPEVYMYDPTKVAKAKGATAPGQESLTLAQRISERASLAGSGELAPIMQNAEAMLRKEKDSLAHALSKLADNYPQFTRDAAKFGEMWTRAVKQEASTSTDALEVEFQNNLNSIVDFLFKEAEVNNISPDLIANAFSNYGLRDANGFTSKGSLKDIFKSAPWGNNPFPEGGDNYFKFEDRKTAFNENNMMPIEGLYKMGAAIFHSKTEQNLAAQLTANFGHESAMGWTASQAKAAGWVKMNPLAFKGSLAHIVNAGSKEVYFHPEIARSFAAVDRAWHALFNKNKMGKIATTIMELTSYLKFTQTTLNLRHHMTNAMGDFSVEFMVGNTNPQLWAMASSMSKNIAKDIWKTDYSKDAMQASLDRLLTNLSSPEELAKQITDVTAKDGRSLKAVIGGKPVALDLGSLAYQVSQRNIATSSMLNDEVLGMYEHITADKAAIGAEREMNKVLATKIRSGIEKGMKPFGDVTAAYSNIPRIAGALHVITSRSWKSEAEMWDAVAKHVHLYHPTISSLAPAERKYGRMFVGYYTWLRGAYTATADLMINHTAGALITPKVFSEVAQANEVDQKSMVAPQNMRGSLYGPLWQVPGGVAGIKTSAMPMDVLDTVPFYYDPMLNSQQMASANYKVLGSFLGGNANPIVRQVAQEIVGTDFQTGATFADRSPQAQMERFILTLGPSQLAKGLGWQPSGKTYTKEQQDLFLRKYLFGTKEYTTADPGIQKAANKENAARIKAWIENLPKENK